MTYRPSLHYGIVILSSKHFFKIFLSQNYHILQKRRARGDTSFLLDSGYFAEQNRLTEEIERQGYTVVNYEDENGNPVYEIEPLLD